MKLQAPGRAATPTFLNGHKTGTGATAATDKTPGGQTTAKTVTNGGAERKPELKPQAAKQQVAGRTYMTPRHHILRDAISWGPSQLFLRSGNR